MTITITVRNGRELFEPTVYKPRKNNKTGEWVHCIFNIKFNVKKETANDPNFGGGGIYAIKYKGKLLYPGIYTGEKVAFSSNVVKQRFTKHIEALTMRGYRVGFSPNNYNHVIKMPNCPLVRAIASNTAQYDNGGVRSYPSKVEFANENWREMIHLESQPEVLEKFDFLYARLNPTDYLHLSHAHLKAYLETIERMLILDTNPRCNVKRFKPNNANLVHGPSVDVWEEFHSMIRSA